jgi:hypothetical protein
MTVVLGWTFLLAAVVVSLGACSSGPERQWYKPGRSYTVADFQRDEADCTKDGRFDEQCMRDRGWVAVSADEDKLPPMQGGPPPSRPRYAPK